MTDLNSSAQYRPARNKAVYAALFIAIVLLAVGLVSSHSQSLVGFALMIAGVGLAIAAAFVFLLRYQRTERATGRRPMLR